jgi:hypothetical protein
MVAPLPILKFYLVQDRTCGKPPNEELGDHSDRLSKAGWSLGWVSALDIQGRTIWIVGASR